MSMLLIMRFVINLIDRGALLRMIIITNRLQTLPFGPSRNLKHLQKD